MKNKFKKAVVLLVLALATLSAGLGAHIIQLNRIHDNEGYELRKELRSAQFDLQGATMHIQQLNEEREENE